MWWFRDCANPARLDGKTAIITGCNSGIGKQAAMALYQRGCKVIMACRNLEKAEKAKRDIEKLSLSNAKNGQLEIRQLDVSSISSIRTFAENVLSSDQQINILVNNAGCAGPMERTSEGWSLIMATNYFGPFLLTLLLLPRIIKSAPARIVNVSSLSYTYSYLNLDDLNSALLNASPIMYGNSKLAIMLFTRELAERLKGTGVTTYSLHPGIIPSNMWDTVERYYIWPYKAIVWLVLRTEEQGAQTIIHCCVDEEAANHSGEYFSDCSPKYTLPKARNKDTAVQLWTRTWELVKLNDFDPFRPR